MLLHTANPISTILLSLVLVAAPLLASRSSSAAEGSGFFEYTQSLNTSTFKKITTIGAFSRGRLSRGELVYGGLQFSHFELKNSVNTSSLYRVLVGATTTGKVSPFIEIGTDILGLFTAGNNNQTNCGNGNHCRIDGFLKVGIRIHLQYAYTLGVFHESIAFSDNHSLLKGDHDYTGMSIGYNF